MATAAAPGAARALSLRLLDYARAAFQKIVSVLPGAARSQKAHTPSAPLPDLVDGELEALPDQLEQSAQSAQSAQSVQSDPSDQSDYSIGSEHEDPLDQSDLRALTHEQLRAEATRLEQLLEAMGMLFGEKQGKTDTEMELQFQEKLGRVHEEIRNRANQNIEKGVAQVLQQALKLATKGGEAAELSMTLNDVFASADGGLRMLEADGFDTGGNGRAAAVAMFVAAGLGNLAVDDRRRLLGAMREEHVERLANADLKNERTLPVITNAQEELAVRGDRSSQDFLADAVKFLDRYPAGASISSRDFKQFAAELGKLDQDLAKLTTDDGGTTKTLSPPLESLRTRVGTRLTELLHHTPKPDALQPEEWLGVLTALKRFGVSPQEDLLVNLSKEAGSHVNLDDVSQRSQEYKRLLEEAQAKWTR
jgi:hypothetical protein